MKQLILLLVVLCSLSLKLSAQSFKLRGIVYEINSQGAKEPVPGATISIIGTNRAAISDTAGRYTIQSDTLPVRLMVRYVGYMNDTLLITGEKEMETVLKGSHQLKEVEIEAGGSSAYMSKMNTINTQLVTERELTKAACCNLSESFETNPAVDVSTNDALTGLKQIQLLGLGGIYNQFTIENLPSIRGLSSYYGLTFTPGPWIEGMQISKGTGSVANGYESISGQINVEERKPFAKERLFINGYASNMGRYELNSFVAKKVGDKTSTALFLHGSTNTDKIDGNKDGFRDMPLGYQYSIYNRWKFAFGKGWEGQVGAKAAIQKIEGGQTDFSYNDRDNNPTVYGFNTLTKKAELYSKTGYVFPSSTYKSLGIISNWQYFEQNALFGKNNYYGKEKTGYINVIYQSAFNDTRYKYRLGASFMADDVSEQWDTNKTTNIALSRTELVPGMFTEYTHAASERFSLVAGLRVDYHNLFGVIVTPRLHMKYDLTEKLQARFSAGRGQRTANPLADNSKAFVSSRVIKINSVAINPWFAEVAWNTGINLSYTFSLFDHDGSITTDAYYTFFTKQLVADYDVSPQQLVLNPITGPSYSQTAQAELNYEPVKRLNIKAAYRYYNVKSMYNNQLQSIPLIAKQRYFTNIEYKTRNKWSFDYTFQWIGQKRLPSTFINPIEYQLAAYSPSYFIMNAQITKSFKGWDIYAGCENLTNYRQKNAFISASNPYSQYFDGSMIWGPIIGRFYNIGFRFKL